MGWLRRKGSTPVEREDRATQSAKETYENNKLVALNYIGDGDYGSVLWVLVFMKLASASTRCSGRD